MEQNALVVLVQFALVIGFMLLGMDIITNVHPMLHKSWRWMLKVMVFRPLRAVGRWAQRELGQFLRWGGRQLLAFLGWCCRQLGRGIRTAWVRLTT